MTVMFDATVKAGRLVPLETKKIDRFKGAHEGQVFTVVLDDGESSALSPLAKKFHAIRDEYAAVNGYENEHAKVELKFLHGVWTQPDSIPVGRDGRLVEYHGEVLWFLSIRDYSPEELERLVAGSDLALMEASV